MAMYAPVLPYLGLLPVATTKLLQHAKVSSGGQSGAHNIASRHGDVYLSQYDEIKQKRVCCSALWQEGEGGPGLTITSHSRCSFRTMASYA
ncbi:hypothetical protein WN944_017132 [Citrus x changshan-huyou]|uniref:Uncharacterized protein n=1 Tax=Citrus x changshan-huyou TaxID=2935761 RepID=A0AAP0MAP3_9ROSI